jgi:hypothetical protein
VKRFTLVSTFEYEGQPAKGVTGRGVQTSGGVLLLEMNDGISVAPFSSIEALLDCVGRVGRTTFHWIDDDGVPA